MDVQPCLLDRLTDDGSTAESQRGFSEARYRDAVLRDLEWLFGASAHLPDEGLDKFPEAYKSVINYGIRHLFGVTSPKLTDLKRALAEALIVFEPRINEKTLQVSTKMKGNIILLDVRAEIWSGSVPQQLHFRTKLDLEGGGS